MLAPKLIDKASKEVDKIAEARIRQAISKSGQKKKKKKKKNTESTENYTKHHTGSYRRCVRDTVQTLRRLFAGEKEALEVIKTKMIEGSVADKIYQSCPTRYKNGWRKLIHFLKGKKCLMPTSRPFWSKDIPLDCTMQMTSSTKKR